MPVGQQTCQLPADPVLQAMAIALRDAGQWGEIVDREWRWTYMTDDLRLSYGGLLELADVALGEHYFGPEAVAARLTWRTGANTVDTARGLFAQLGDLVLADTPGGRDELRERVHPQLRALVDGLSPRRVPAQSFEWRGVHSGNEESARVTAVRLHDDAGRFAGTVLTYKPAASMTVLGTIAGAGDLRHFERMQSVAKPARRPAAILFADLDGSSPLARRLSTASYFALGRRLVRAADQCIIDAGGLVGRHRRRRSRRVLSGRDRRVGIRRRSLGASKPRERFAERSAGSPSAADSRQRTSSCGLGCTGAPGSTSARSPPADARRSTPSATRSTRPPASRRAPAADARWPRRT